MQEKLTIAHLAPYLPYGLKCKFYEKGCSDKSEGYLSGISKNAVYLTKFIGGTHCVNIGPFVKPILRPLSDCEQYLNIEGGIELDSSLLSLNGYLNSINIYPDGSEWTHSIDVYNNIYVYLFQHHFDVFGLIEKGMAVSTNDSYNG